ncbi:MFS transporter [Fodinicola feengrottensis]|uniref:MFS transporter n=1 Tax=Fodinicola feengrottensis TaxID=435914 RepID=UPI0013D737C7|nr:MFS transporter [Fodinicola feengrottensis]
MTLAAGRVATTVPLRRNNRQFRLLWIGQALSDFGSSMTSLAVPLALLAAGYSPSAAGIIGTAMLIVGLAVRVPAGYLADRWDQRRLMLGCDLARLVAVAARRSRSASSFGDCRCWWRWGWWSCRSPRRRFSSQARAKSSGERCRGSSWGRRFRSTRRVRTARASPHRRWPDR